MAGNEPDRTSRRRRVTALLSQEAFAQLERIAARTGRSNAAVAERLLNGVLKQDNVERTISQLTIDGNVPVSADQVTGSKQHQ